MTELSIASVKGDFFGLLLATVSVATLCAVLSAQAAHAEDADRPTIWIELGGTMQHISGQGDPFAVPFLAVNPTSPVLQPITPLQAQRPSPFDFGMEGKITLQSAGSDWVFSAGVRYGRSGATKHVAHQTTHVYYRNYKYGIGQGAPHTVEDFADTQFNHKESYTILDFSAGKDVGLGLFGKSGSSTLNFGVRFAQFASNTTFDVRARPDLRFKPGFSLPTFHVSSQNPYFHTYHESGTASRNFHGVGPSLSWNAAAAVAGDPQDGVVSLDWGVNAALLFGRQRARVQHVESSRYFLPTFNHAYHHYQNPAAGHAGARTVTIPNVGGFAGAMYRIESFKISLGYRADFFFGAMDGGVDTAKKENVGFYGPFASVSVGIGG